MKVSELIEALKQSPPDAEILFDTEARTFNCHMIPIDSAGYEPLCEEQGLGKSFILFNKGDGRHDQGRITWYKPSEKMPEVGDEIVCFDSRYQPHEQHISCGEMGEKTKLDEWVRWTYASNLNLPKE